MLADLSPSITNVCLYIDGYLNTRLSTPILTFLTTFHLTTTFSDRKKEKGHLFSLILHRVPCLSTWIWVTHLPLPMLLRLRRRCWLPWLMLAVYKGLKELVWSQVERHKGSNEKLHSTNLDRMKKKSCLQSRQHQSTSIPPVQLPTWLVREL